MRDQGRDDMKCTDAPIEVIIKDKGLPAGSRVPHSPLPLVLDGQVLAPFREEKQCGIALIKQCRRRIEKG
jgi:hypothetical protein